MTELRRETTYCLSTNQPTNQPVPTGTNELPEEYTSLRITIKHVEYPSFHDAVLYDLTWYISYPHFGKDKTNEHYHVFFEPGITERIRKRIKSHFGDGNRVFSLKSFKNGLGSGVQYGSKEGTTPYVVGSDSAQWIACSPTLINHNALGFNSGTSQKQLKNSDHFRQITYSNMERVCHRYRKDNGIQSTSLEVVLAHMHANGWRLQVTVLRNGIPATIFSEFSAQCDGRTTYTHGKFLRMKVMEKWGSDYLG